VREVAVIATADERWQERPLVIVVPDDPAADAAALREYLRDKVARFWLPEYWSFAGEIPKTSVGKLDKKRLRDLNEAGEIEIQVVRQ